ncbi:MULTISPECIES: LexA family protein [Bacteroidales]|jgi:DNA polymerase V|uniref:LexA family protein n=1 Tax=Bacteroidales TaxID=171549 RepID=UPI0006B326A7|nr:MULTISPECIES: S24 family peptidase [Bacteroidales]MCW1736249.1 translesion error-prone DNA polymerase V autoproteolytic subunit [Seramator thermalis]
MKKQLNTQKIELIQPESSEQKYPYIGNVQAGFPSPADDFFHDYISLDELLVDHKETTFFARVSGSSMGNDFSDGDLLIIDKSLEWEENKIALCFIDGEFTLKRIKMKDGKCFLVPSNKDFPLLEVNYEQGVTIWGVVKYSIRKH